MSFGADSIEAREPSINMKYQIASYRKVSFLFRGFGHLCCCLQYSPLAYFANSLKPSCRIEVGDNFVYHVPTMYNKTRSFCVSGWASGENPIILGPMFAGKTSTMVKRTKTENNNFRSLVNPLRNTWHLDTILRDLCYSGRLKEAVGILCCTEIQAHHETYSLILQECIFRKQYKKGRRIHWHMVVVGFVPTEYLKIKLLILYAKSGDLDTAHLIFDILEIRTMVSWNAIIAGYVQKGLEDVGLSLYHRMRQFGLMPDQYTFASVFRACSSLAILEQGKQAHGILVKSQINGNVVVNSALMDMYFKCSSPSDAFGVFSKSLNRNVVTWSSLMYGYGLHGRVFEVMDFFQQMLNEGLKPNQITYLALLSACNHVGLVEEGKKYFSSMRDYGVYPRGKHYAVMVDLLGRAGKIEEAYSFVCTSPFKGHPAVWGALLSACKLYGNMEILKVSAKKFFELEPQNTGKYVVLSNAYATFGLWKNVMEIRRVMKGSGIRKEPGYSMIEVQKEAHMFFMVHNTHRQLQQILLVLKNLSDVLKDVQCIPHLCIEPEKIMIASEF